MLVYIFIKGFDVLSEEFVSVEEELSGLNFAADCAAVDFKQVGEFGLLERPRYYERLNADHALPFGEGCDFAMPMTTAVVFQCVDTLASTDGIPPPY